MNCPGQQPAVSLLQGYPGPQAAMLGGVVLLMYLAGWLYSRHLPERWRPGAYDLVGNSHQWMHALVSTRIGPCLRQQSALMYTCNRCHRLLAYSNSGSA